MKRIHYDSPEPPAVGDLLQPISRVTGLPTRSYRIHAVREVRRVSRSTPGPRWNLTVTDEPYPVQRMHEAIWPLYWYPRRRSAGRETGG